MADVIEQRIVKIQTPTPEKLAPYGTVLGYNPAVAPLPIDFYGGGAQVRRLCAFEAPEMPEMPVVTVQRRPLEVQLMERHPLHTQAFISLGGTPFIACFAPPNDADLPDPDKVEAFLFDGSAGFMMHKGTWHDFPFAIVDGTNLLVILTKAATDGLTSDNVFEGEAIGPDIQKMDIGRRLGVTFKLEY